MLASKSKSLVETSKISFKLFMSYEFEVKSPINLSSACYQVSYFTATLSAGTKLQFMQFLTFRSQCGCVYTQAIKQMVYTETVKNDPHKFCRLNWPCCYNCTFKIYQKHLFSRVKRKNMEIAVLSFITVYTHASKMAIIRQYISRQFY